MQFLYSFISATHPHSSHQHYCQLLLPLCVRYRLYQTITTPLPSSLKRISLCTDILALFMHPIRVREGVADGSFSSMAIKIFLLGRPGSGKSTAAQYIDMMTREYGWSSMHINDYDFLHAMYQEDTHYQRFRPSVYGGFDVLDFSVLDQALHSVEAKACRYMAFSKRLLLLEFARDNYQKALKQFQPAFLRDAYFLFFEANIEMCVRRVYERSSNPLSCNDHFISEQMIRSYYHEDNRPYLTYNLLADYGISDKKVRVINNTGSRKELKVQIKSFVKTIVEPNRGGLAEFRSCRSIEETYHA